jgi:AraC-like DNA-binding protein
VDIQRYVPSFDSKKCFFAMPVVLFKHILKGESSGERFTKYPPGADLAAVIEYFFLYQLGASSTCQLAFADGLPTLVLLPGAAGEFLFVTPRTRKVQQAGYLVGSVLEGVYLETKAGEGSLLGVRFTPQGLHHLLGYSLQSLRSGLCWDLAEAFGPAALPLLDYVQGNASTQDKIARIEQFIRGCLRCFFAPNALFTEAINHIRKAKGQLRMNELARMLKVDYKWLERQFLCYLGISPKEFARCQRFLHAYFDLQASLGRDAMGAAVRNGYYDQNHLGKEFKRFTRLPPLAYWQGQGGGL